MALDFIPLDRYRTKFYQRDNSSKAFAELSEEQLSIVAKKADAMKQALISSGPRKTDSVSPLEVYCKTLQYLTHQHIYLDLKSFDERIAFLIIMTDPELITFKEFLKLDLVSTTEINQETDVQKKELLKQQRKQTLSTYENMLREKIGFFDLKLLKYEELFFKRFYNEKVLITEVGTNNQDRLTAGAKLLKNFNNISDERYEELVYIAQTWSSLVPEENRSKVAAYSVINQKKLLGLHNLSEQLALFILLADSNLDMLRIYEDESMMEKIKNRIIKKFGYFNQELLILERKFHDRFCPNEKLSEWPKTKKR